MIYVHILHYLICESVKTLSPKIRIFDLEGLRDVELKNIFNLAKFEETIKI